MALRNIDSFVYRLKSLYYRLQSGVFIDLSFKNKRLSLIIRSKMDLEADKEAEFNCLMQKMEFNKFITYIFSSLPAPSHVIFNLNDSSIFCQFGRYTGGIFYDFPVTKTFDNQIYFDSVEKLLISLGFKKGKKYIYKKYRIYNEGDFTIINAYMGNDYGLIALLIKRLFKEVYKKDIKKTKIKVGY